MTRCQPFISERTNLNPCLHLLSNLIVSNSIMKIKKKSQGESKSQPFTVLSNDPKQIQIHNQRCSIKPPFFTLISHSLFLNQSASPSPLSLSLSLWVNKPIYKWRLIIDVLSFLLWLLKGIMYKCIK